MSFDWKSFFEAEGVKYVVEGKNVAKGHVNICCPMCGDDPSFHMGVQLETGFWGCYRNPQHRGKDPARLIRVIKGCSKEQAVQISRDPLLGETVPLHELGRLARTLFDGFHEPKQSHPLRMPDEFRPVEDTAYRARFWDYLHDDRKFGRHTQAIVDRYDLRCCLSGRWRNRVILPLHKARRVVGWLGRSVERHAELRYLSHPPGNEGKLNVYNYDNARRGGDVLAVVEGSFDAINVDYHGHDLGLSAVGLLSTSATSSQLLQILKLARRFRRVVVLLDDGALLQGMLLRDRLALASPYVRPLVEADDPAEMSRQQIRALARRIH